MESGRESGRGEGDGLGRSRETGEGIGGGGGGGSGGWGGWVGSRLAFLFQNWKRTWTKASSLSWAQCVLNILRKPEIIRNYHQSFASKFPIPQRKRSVPHVAFDILKCQNIMITGVIFCKSHPQFEVHSFWKVETTAKAAETPVPGIHWPLRFYAISWYYRHHPRRYTKWVSIGSSYNYGMDSMKNLIFIAFSDERWLYYQFPLTFFVHFFLKGSENVLFELGSARVNLWSNGWRRTYGILQCARQLLVFDTWLVYQLFIPGLVDTDLSINFCRTFALFAARNSLQRVGW